MNARPTTRHRLPAGIAATLLGLTVAVTGCAVQEITYTQNGEVVEPDDLPPEIADVDACTALSDDTLDLLGLSELEPVEVMPPQTGCEWSGYNDYVVPSLIVWVGEPEEGDPTDEIVTIDGIPVNVFSALGNTGRYIAYLDDVTLTVNFKGAELEIDAHTALEAAMSDVLRHYGRS